jgi:acyl-CoA synthetase (AMP-forming)/AMP-acid ligase II
MAPLAIGEALRARAARDCARPALLAPAEQRELSFGQLASLSARLAELAGGTGATIAVCTESRLAQGALLAAGLMAGCVVCPINPAASPEVRERLLRHARARLLVGDVELAEAAALGARAAIAGSLLAGLAEAPAVSVASEGRGGMLVYTSGSTGDPKGVLLNEAQIGANVAFAVSHFGYGEDWVAGSVLPLFHTFTVISDLLPMLVCGGRVVVTPGFAISQLPASAGALVEHRVRSYSGVPIVFDMMLALRVPLPESMRFSIAGAAPLSEATRARYLRVYGHPILPCYGLTETTCFATASAPDAIRPSSVGRAAGIEVDIFDEAGASVPRGVTGEIAHRGASVIRGGYYEDAGKNAHAFTGAGWFLSGDMGHLDADGFLFITGRKKNMLIRGGEKVYLEDVDRCLASHPQVADSCTVRVGGQRHEEQAVAFVVPRGAAPEKQSVVDHVTAVLGLIARLDDVVITTEIPRSATGKVLREVLVSRYGEPR